MLSLLLVTITTSVTDSLNPVGIAQQFVLQGLVKKKHHIWAYILSVALTNFLFGLIFYLGAGAFIDKYFAILLSKYSNIIYICEFILGILLLMSISIFIMKIYTNKLQKEIDTLKGMDASQNKSHSPLKIKSVNPLSLCIIGILATCAELTTALPYFAFLTILINYDITLLTVILILLLYNIIYSTPLIILYLLYVKCQSKFDELYTFLKAKVSKYGQILSPILIGSIGVFLIFNSLISL